MAMFKPISYTYIPTPPRSKGTAACHNAPPKQFRSLDKKQRVKPSNVEVEKRQMSAAAPAPARSDHNRDERSKGRAGMGTARSNNEQQTDDDDLPTLEEILYTRLEKEGFAKGFATEDLSTEHTVEEVEVSESRHVSCSRPASGGSSGTSRNDPIVLGEDESDACEIEVDDGIHRSKSAEPDVGPLGSIETAFDSRTSMPPSCPDGCHGIERHDSIEMAQPLQLAEPGSSLSDFRQPYSPSLRSSSERLHDRTGTEDLCADRARSEATMPRSGSFNIEPPHCSRALPPYQLSQEKLVQTGQNTPEEDELLRPTLGTSAFDEENRWQQAEEMVEEDDDDDRRPQREVNNVAAALAARGGCRTRFSSREDGSARRTSRHEPLASRDPSPEVAQETTSDSDDCSDDELSNAGAESDEEQIRARPAKRKRPSSSHDSPTQKRLKHDQQRSTRHPQPRCKPQRFRAEDRLPSPAPSIVRAMDIEMLSDCCNVGRLCPDIRPMLSEVTFRPHSPHHCSFTAVIRTHRGRPELSFGHLASLIENIGHVGKIGDLTIKPLAQYSFLVTGFSQHTSSRLSHSETTIVSPTEVSRVHGDATGIRFKHVKGVDVGATASEKVEPSTSDDDGGLSDSDSNPSSDDDGDSSEAGQGRSGVRKHRAWSALDEQRLLVYKKEGKSWSWIFRKFPGRTSAAVRTRLSMVQARVK